MLLSFAAGCRNAANRTADLGADGGAGPDWRSHVNSASALDEPVVDTATANADLVLITSCSPPDQTPRVDLQWVDAVPPDRLDVSIVYQGFTRRLFTTAYPLAPGAPFLLPASSAFLTDDVELRNLGASTFPLVVDFASSDLEGAPGQEQVRIALGGLAGAISYTLRALRHVGDHWETKRQTTFLSPVCITSF
jgi:hypothetical protein